MQEYNLNFNAHRPNIPTTTIPSISYYRSYYSRNRLNIDLDSAEVQEYIDKISSFIKKINNGEDVYVKYNEYSTNGRKGTIAKVSKISKDVHGTSFLQNCIDEKGNRNKKLNEHMLSAISERIQLEVKFDDRKNKLKIDMAKVSWLEDYTGSTEWHYTKPVKKLPTRSLADRLGTDVTVGDLVMYASNEWGGVRTYIGNVVSISERNVVYCRNIKLNEGDMQYTKRITNNSSIIRLTKEIFDEVMLRKLMH